MKDRPILFKGEMVRALLDGSKTQTRRIVKPTPPPGAVSFGTYYHPDPRPHFWAFDGDALMDFAVPCPYGQPGDQLWVRESWAPTNPISHGVMYRADFDSPTVGPWKPSIHMPRWASRITLEITDVRVERLQDISADDARAEGCPDRPVPGAEQASVDAFARQWYGDLWESINGPGSWALNPWVWVISSHRVEKKHGSS